MPSHGSQKIALPSMQAEGKDVLPGRLQLGAEIGERTDAAPKLDGYPWQIGQIGGRSCRTAVETDVAGKENRDGLGLRIFL